MRCIKSIASIGIQKEAEKQIQNMKNCIHFRHPWDPDLEELEKIIADLRMVLELISEFDLYLKKAGSEICLYNKL